MRELKFRAWHETDKCWYNPRFIEMNLLGQAIMHHGLEQFEIIPASAIEQYTGLKDKNGKKIYEGDIVKFADLELAMKPTGVVCFADGRFFVKDWEFNDGSYHIVDFYDYNIPHKDFEVIGNIHEKSELLEDENGKN